MYLNCEERKNKNQKMDNLTTTASPKAHQWNITEPKMDTNFAILLCSLLFAILWVTYIIYYNSRLVGYILTKLINELIIKEGYFKIGSKHPSICCLLN